MKFDKTLKTVDEIIDAIEDQIHNGDTILNEARYLELQSICGKIDSLVESFEGTAVDVSADEISLSITIGIVCPEVVIRNAMFIIWMRTGKKYSFCRQKRLQSMSVKERRQRFRLCRKAPRLLMYLQCPIRQMLLPSYPLMRMAGLQNVRWEIAA